MRCVLLVEGTIINMLLGYLLMTRSTEMLPFFSQSIHNISSAGLRSRDLVAGASLAAGLMISKKLYFHGFSVHILALVLCIGYPSSVKRLFMMYIYYKPHKN